MGEDEWLNSASPREMLSVAYSAGERKLRLFSLACCQRMGHLITHSGSRAVLAFLERHAAHGLARRKGIVSVRKAAQMAVFEVTRSRRDEPAAWAAVHAPLVAVAKCPVYAADFASMNAANALWWSEAPANAATNYPPDSRMQRILGDQAALLRDIVGNPFRPASADPSWLTRNDGAALRIAQSIFDENTFDQLPILADALEDAGCTDADILDHCRGPGPHVRGCWVVKALLVKS